ncbi:3-dehydroquinate synthase [soil metagenome]
MSDFSIRHSRGNYQVRFMSLASSKDQLENSFVITDTNVEKSWHQLLPSTAKRLALPPGEQTKSLIWFDRACQWLAEEGADRHSTIVAFGGGVIGDLVGFVAASYMRGVKYIQIPTTLLAQVDSSVGGKVAVDIPQGKNLVGAFYPPELVAVDPYTLATLSARQFRNGMAEVCKYGFILDPTLATKLANNVINGRSNDLESIISRCIELKKDCVEHDEFETTGLRAKLNFGHTIGHALEQMTGYKSYLHGEAVAIGMVAESKLGEMLGVTLPGTTESVIATLKLQGLPVTSEHLTMTDELMASMKRDKKARSGSIAFSLLTEMGGCKLVEDVGESDIRAALLKL